MALVVKTTVKYIPFKIKLFVAASLKKSIEKKRLFYVFEDECVFFLIRALVDGFLDLVYYRLFNSALYTRCASLKLKQPVIY